MPRKPDMPPGVYDVLVDLRLRLSLSPGHPAEVKVGWYREAKDKVGPRAAQVALWIVEAGVPSNQVNQYYLAETNVEQANNPGGQSVTQKAGGDMVGVNAQGTQTIRDITIYKQDLDQSGAVINDPMRAALIETREGIEAAEIDAAIKPMLIEQFDKLTGELKKGDAKNPSTVKAIWTVIYSTIKAIPAAATCYTGLEKLSALLAPYF